MPDRIREAAKTMILEGFRSFGAACVSIDLQSVYAYLGYPDEAAVSAIVGKRVPELVEETIRHAKPRAIAAFVDMQQAGPDSILLQGGPRFSGRLLARAMKPAAEVALFALTAGRELSDWIKKEFAPDPHGAFIADAIASVLTDTLADRLQDRLAAEATVKGLFAGYRYSPGYCDWPIKQMPSLLTRIQARKIGISLTSGGMMIPEKSICGIIGFGPDAAKMKWLPCSACGRTECPYRRSKED